MKNKLKCDYVKNCLNEHKHDSKKLWRDIRQFWLSSKSAKTKIGNINGAETNLEKAENLNIHFASIGGRLAAEIDMLPPDITSCFDLNRMPPVFEIAAVTEKDVLLAIEKLSPSKSCSTDGITSFMIKSCKVVLSPVLLSLFNLSIISRTFPNCWKLAKIRPLFKSGSIDDPSNFRPISIIPTVGKILERLVHDQMSKYLESWSQ